MAMIKAGELRDKIVFQQPVRSQNDSGGTITVYNTVLSTFAKAREVSSDPRLIGSQEDIINRVEFTIRYRPMEYIREAYRIQWRGNNFIVNNIQVDPLRTWIKITVSSEMDDSRRESTVVTNNTFTYTFPFNLA